MAKVSSFLLLLGIAAGVGIVFTGNRIAGIDAAYREALEGPARATLLLARANRFVVTFSLNLHQALASLTPEEREAAVAAEAEALDRAEALFEEAARIDPVHAARIEVLRAELAQIIGGSCAATRERVNGAADVQQRLLAGEEWTRSCTPLFSRLSKEIAAVSDTQIENLRVAEGVLKGDTTQTVIVIYASLFGGLVLMLLLALAGVRYGVIRPQERLKAERAAIAADFETKMGLLAEALASSSNEVQMAARNLSVSAEETSRQAIAVTGAAEEASNNVQTVAAATEELTSSIGEIGAQVSRAADMAVDGSQEVNRTASDIRELSEAAAKIGEVVKLITDIAAQTNLLALNATIEAARAGDAGRGFAVVAQEVKQLADQTARATQEIGHKVADIQKATGRTVGSIESIVATIAQIREATAMIASAVQEQTAATHEIASNVHMAADGTGAVNDNIAGVSRAAEMTGAASTQLSSLSTSLSDQADEMQRRVDDIVRSLRASG
nr:methyl-accepting chemotaxis protein [Prosthecomicrobium pneumaticum]